MPKLTFYAPKADLLNIHFYAIDNQEVTNMILKGVFCGFIGLVLSGILGDGDARPTSLWLPVFECPSLCRIAIYSRLPTEKAMSLPLLRVLAWLSSYGGSAD